MTSNFSRIGAATALFALSLGGAAAAGPATFRQLVFEAPHFASVENGRTISYRFVRKTDDPKLSPSFEDDVKVLVGPKGAENSVKVDLFTGERAQEHPNMSKVGNPVIVTVLEQDVQEMNKTLGGSVFYFRIRLKDALAEEKPAEPTKVEYNGKTIDGWKIALKPFADDAKNRGKLREYADRSYEMIFAEGVPGGLYALKTVTPKADGGALLTEELTVSQEQPK